MLEELRGDGMQIWAGDQHQSAGAQHPLERSQGYG